MLIWCITFLQALVDYCLALKDQYLMMCKFPHVNLTHVSILLLGLSGLPVYLSVCLPVCLLVCVLSVCLSVCLFACLFFLCLSVYIHVVMPVKYITGIMLNRYIYNSHPSSQPQLLQLSRQSLGLEIQGRGLNSQPEALELHFSQLVPVGPMYILLTLEFTLL